MPDTTLPDVLLGKLIETAAWNTCQKAVVLIDEYDTPITENINRPDVLDTMLDFIRTFYGVLKDLGDDIHFTFMTGITRLAHTGLFSGANHMTDISVILRYATLLGFTAAELWSQPDIMA